MNRQDIFQNIYDKRIWADSGNSETPAGPGSNVSVVKPFVERLNEFLMNNNVKSILDIGCGASKWQEDLNLDGIEYLGIDIVNIEKKLPFQVHDIVEGPLDRNFDLILMRNVIQHQTLDDITQILKNIQLMKPRFIITNYHDVRTNSELRDNDVYRFRRVNLTVEPFNLPNPIDQINTDQVMGVWLGEDLYSQSEVSITDDTPTVLIAILAKNKAHTLPIFLDRVLNQEYPKDKIKIYIRTNNNKDNTLEILTKFKNDYESDYNKIILEGEDVENINSAERPHEWNSNRFKTLGRIRQRSLDVCLEEKCDYYFVIDCDNFITPLTLSYLVNKRKPIIAPILKAIPKEDDFYSNFFSDIDKNGYYKNKDQYCNILYKKIVGTFRVPVVHCTYLIDAKVIPSLCYDDNTGRYEFVIFSHSARKSLIAQYITNEKYFGELLHPADDITLEDEAKLVNDYFNESVDHPEEIK